MSADMLQQYRQDGFVLIPAEQMFGLSMIEEALSEIVGAADLVHSLVIPRLRYSSGGGPADAIDPVDNFVSLSRGPSQKAGEDDGLIRNEINTLKVFSRMEGVLQLLYWGVERFFHKPLSGFFGFDLYPAVGQLTCMRPGMGQYTGDQQLRRRIDLVERYVGLELNANSREVAFSKIPPWELHVRMILSAPSGGDVLELCEGSHLELQDYFDTNREWLITMLAAALDAGYRDREEALEHFRKTVYDQVNQSIAESAIRRVVCNPGDVLLLDPRVYYRAGGSSPVFRYSNTRVTLHVRYWGRG